jgi:hypothetical protein
MKSLIKIAAALLIPLFSLTASIAIATDLRPVTCEGTYTHHLQGVCADEQDAIYWCFTTELVKTDRSGKIVKQTSVASHHGDLCYRNGRVFVAVNLGPFNDPKENADSWVYVYDANDLSLLSKHKTPEVVYGAGGIEFFDGKFLVVGGLPENAKENYIYEYDDEFRFVKKHVLPGGYTYKGIQTAAFADGYWWFGCYGDPKILLKADASLQKVERFEFEGSLGIVPVGQGKFLVARGNTVKGKGRTARLVPAEVDKKRGLKLVDSQRQ